MLTWWVLMEKNKTLKKVINLKGKVNFWHWLPPKLNPNLSTLELKIRFSTRVAQISFIWPNCSFVLFKYTTGFLLPHFNKCCRQNSSGVCVHLWLMDAHITRQKRRSVHFSSRPFRHRDEVNPDFYKKTICNAHCKHADRGTTMEGINLSNSSICH